jgi:hypothetical protein
MGHVTFVHGILNKTAPEELVQLWRRGLAEEDGFNLGARGVTSSMVYWADVLYDKPLVESAHAESLEAAAEAGAVDPLPMEWRAQLRGKERDLVEGLARDLGYDEVEEEDPPPAGPQTGPSLERVPLPGFVKKRIMGHRCATCTTAPTSTSARVRTPATASRRRSASASSPRSRRAAVARARTSS